MTMCARIVHVLCAVAGGRQNTILVMTNDVALLMLNTHYAIKPALLVI